MSVFETKIFESDTRSIVDMELAKQAVEKHRSDLLAVGERNVDLRRFSPSEIGWSCSSVAGDGIETISVQ